MSSELEPYESDATLEEFAEFQAYPAEVRQAALEFARYLAQGGEVTQQEHHLDAEPQFILIGVQQHGRSLLFASTQVKTTKFARRVTGIDQVGAARIPRMSILVGAELGSFEQYIGDDYRQLLQTLLSEWDRKVMAQQRQLPSG